MSLAKMRRELDAAIDMANIGRDHSWMPVINELDRKIKAAEKAAKNG